MSIGVAAKTLGDSLNVAIMVMVILTTGFATGLMRHGQSSFGFAS
jgi:hypothetical protein